jgi:Protein of unknown function, DUF481/Domain of unknown function (DUF202)
MPYDAARQSAEQDADPRVDLAVLRSELAEDRTLLAWLRIALALIGAGVAFDKGTQLLGGGYGRYWIRTNTTSLRWLPGAVYTREAFTIVAASGQTNDSNLEGLLGASYDSYRFRFGEFHLEGLLFPGLTDSGRIRATTSDSLKIKLANNFYLSFDFWDNFDSRSPTTTKKNELGVSSSIGWSF